MDRRQFLKVILAASLAIPLLTLKAEAKPKYGVPLDPNGYTKWINYTAPYIRGE